MNTTAKFLRFTYSLICYAIGVAFLIYFIVFVNDLFLTKTVNSTVEVDSIWMTLVVNVFAIGVFGVQHSVMARGEFKRWLMRYIHPSMERSTYVLMTAFAIGAMCYLWVPFGPVVWRIETETTAWFIRGLALFGWLFLLLATFLIDHFELFGLSQTFNPLRGTKAPERHFKTPGLYRIVRHPIQTGVLIGMWSVPISTMSHVLFSAGMTLYILVGLYFEEKDLVREFGSTYLDYMGRVKRLIPFIT